MDKKSVRFKDLLDINIISLTSGSRTEFEKINIGIYDFIVNENFKEREDVYILVLTHEHNSSFTSKNINERLSNIKDKAKGRKIVILYTSGFQKVNELNKIIDSISFFGTINTNFLAFLNMLEDIKTEKYHSIIHATLVSIYDEGVLFKGPAGIGKSELAVSLINRGHFLVADDSVNIFYDHGKLTGFPSRKVDGFLEVRGIGIVNVKKTFGIQTFTPSHKIDLVIELEHYNSVSSNEDRLNNEIGFENILGIDVPKVKVYVSPGKSLVDLVEVAIINEKYRKYDNYDGTSDFLKKLKE